MTVIALAIVRTLIGLFFVAEGVLGFVLHEAFVETFMRWRIPQPEFSVPILAAIAIVCGLLVMIGWLVRPAALVLATILVEVGITGGRIDGGISMIAPSILFPALVYYAWRSGRYAAWSPSRPPGTQ